MFFFQIHNIMPCLTFILLCKILGYEREIIPKNKPRNVQHIISFCYFCAQNKSYQEICIYGTFDE